MAENSKISWTDHTFNPWWGCLKVAPGCDNCYAEKLDKRIGGDFWREKPKRTSEANWKKVLKWHKQAVAENKRYKVFCGSMMDWCDKNAPEGALNDLWDLIRATPMIDWLLLTKRASRIKQSLPEDWDSGYNNVWLGITVENMEHGYKRIEAFKNIPAVVKFVSAEPLLEHLHYINLFGIDWVICGGESGPNFRPFRVEWAEDLYLECQRLDVNIPFFFKQHGGNTKDKGGCLLNGFECKEYPYLMKEEQ